MNRRLFIAEASCFILGSAFKLPVKTNWKSTKVNIVSICNASNELIANILPIATPTINGRVYSKDVLQKIVTEFVPGFGQLGMTTDQTIRLTEISHKINSIYLEDGYLRAKISILDTPNGKTLKSLVNDKDNIAFRTSGIGSIDSNMNIEMDYKLTGIHAVEDNPL